jgi:hypothetical protein
MARRAPVVNPVVWAVQVLAVCNKNIIGRAICGTRFPATTESPRNHGGTVYAGAKLTI